MAKLSVANTLSQIDEAILAARGESYDSHGISMSSLGHPCLRKSWYDLRRVSAHEDFDARMIRLFETGEIYETRLLDLLEKAGYEVQRFDENGRQIKANLAGGFLRGKLDGRVLGIPEAPKSVHVVECKSHNQKNFDILVKKGVKEAKFEHYLQTQLYMHETGDKRALYMAVCKNDDTLYIERLEYDADFCMRYEQKAQQIALAEVPPQKLHEDPNSRMAFECRFCRHKPICHDKAFPKSANCRNCVFAQPVADGKGSWHCTRHDKALTWDEQKEGCGGHLFIPELIPGEVVHFDEVNHVATYKLHDGREWQDGAAPELVADKPEGDPEAVTYWHHPESGAYFEEVGPVPAETARECNELTSEQYFAAKP